MNFWKDDQKILKDYLSRSIIGLGYGIVRTRELVLAKDISPQNAMDSLGIWIGREIMKTLLEKGVAKVKDDDEKLVNSLLKVINLATELDVSVSGDKIKLVVQKCLICPKRVGGYNLEGNTACPVGGIVTGALSYARGTNAIISKNNLQTGEICHIEVDTLK